MEIFNIGPLELIFILILALVVLGPEGMLNSARKIGQTIAKVVRSPIWRDFMRTSQEIREIPTRFAREAGIEETMREVNETNRQIRQEARSVMNSVGEEARAVAKEVHTEASILPPPLMQPGVPEDSARSENTEQP